MRLEKNRTMTLVFFMQTMPMINWQRNDSHQSQFFISCQSKNQYQTESFMSVCPIPSLSWMS